MSEQRVGELVRQRMSDLTPSERRLGRVLLSSCLVAGLESLARFAERAAVSPPTVTRFVGKLGFRGYPEFQDSLRREVEARLSSPLARYEDQPASVPPGSLLDRAFDAFARGVELTRRQVVDREFEEVAELLADRRRRVFVLGGRVTGALARYLAGQLHLLRPGVMLLDERSAPSAQLVDIGRRDVLVAFDYRRYQRDTIQALRAAAEAGAIVVLVTDPWLSPASASARHVLVTSVSTVAPFDSLVGAVALIEALVAAALSRLGAQAEQRMRRLEALGANVTWVAGSGA